MQWQAVHSQVIQPLVCDKRPEKPSAGGVLPRSATGRGRNGRVTDAVRSRAGSLRSSALRIVILVTAVGDLPRLEIPPEVQREQVAGELAAALGRLRGVRDSYWDQQWRREHRGFGRYPENELWEAVEGYLDLYDASQADPGNASGRG